MWRIAKRLWLGDRRDARDAELLRRCRVTHVLNCARETPCWHRGDFRYCHLHLTDPDPEFHESIERICRFIRRGRRAGGVLVHCAAGLSRSPAAICAYLCHRGLSVEQALDWLARGIGERRRDFVAPDASFLEQIEVYFEDRWE